MVIDTSIVFFVQCRSVVVCGHSDDSIVKVRVDPKSKQSNSFG